MKPNTKKLNKAASYSIDLQDFVSNRFYNPKLGVEEYLDNFRERTGLKDYLNQVNSILNEENNTKKANDENKEPESLIDIPEIKESIDKIITSRHYVKTIDILNKLQNIVINDPKVPDGLKGVTMDAKLINYIKSNIQSEEQNIDYFNNLKPKDIMDTSSDQREMAYFNFDSKDSNGNI